MIKAVIFDMDGVLIDSEVEYIRRFKAIFNSLKVEYKQEDLNAIIGSSKETTNAILTRLGKGVLKAEDFWAIWIKQLKENPIDYASIRVEGAIETLEYLKKNNYKIGLASSTEKEDIIKEMEICGLLPYFDAIASGHECENSKPDPAVYLMAMDRLGVKGEDCVVVEDSAYGIEAGKNANAYVLGRRPTEFSLDQSKADEIIEDLREVIAVLER